MSKISNLEANLELINLAKSINCLDEFSKRFDNLVSSGCLTNVFGATIDTIANLNCDNDIDKKCMIISDKFNECYIMYLDTYSSCVIDIIEHISNKNIKQDVLHALLVGYMRSEHIYPTKFVDIIDLDELYLMFIEKSRFTISYQYEQIYLHFKNNKVDIDKYNDIIVDNIIRKGDKDLVNLDIFCFTSEQHNKLNLYGCLNTIDTLHQIMMKNKFNYSVVKHIFDTNPNYTPDIFIYNDVMRYFYGDNIDKIFELLKFHDCIPQYINIVKYVIRYDIDISLESLDTNYLGDYGINNRYLKSLINIVVINPDDKKIYIPKYHENIVLPVNKYFDDDDYVNNNSFLASIIGRDNEIIKVNDFRDIVKQKYKHYIYSLSVYTHVDSIYIIKDYTYIKTDNYIDYVLDKYSP